MKLDHPYLPFFKVNAEWMKACGYPEESKIFKAIKLEVFWDASFVTVEKDDYPWVLDCRHGQFCATAHGRKECK